MPLLFVLRRSTITFPNSSTTTSSLHPFALYRIGFCFCSSINNQKKPKSSAMQDTEEDIKRQETEGVCKGACEYKPSKCSADDILPHILNLYGSSASARDFEIYAPHATFEDPLMCAHGIKQIKSAFYSIPKVFSESRIVEYSVKENTISHGKKEILIDNKQYYKFLGKGIDMISLIRLYVEEGKVVRHEDWWDKNRFRIERR